MPVPLVLVGVAAATGVFGVGKNIQAAVRNKNAKAITEEAQEIYNTATEKLEKQRKITSSDMDSYAKVKLKSYSEDIGRFLECYGRFKKVDISGVVKQEVMVNGQAIPLDIRSMTRSTMTAKEVIQGGVASLGAGAMTGIAAYGGTMLLAHASTGTAISTLSGVAAKNATLAWLGGGAKTAGGLGMAGGSAVLGGLVIGPILAVQGVITAAKAKENLAKAEAAYSEAEVAAEKMNVMTLVMEKVSETSKDYKAFIIAVTRKYQEVLRHIGEIYERAYADQEKLFWNRIKSFFGLQFKVDATLIPEYDLKYLHYSWLATQVLYKTLVAPLMTEEGNLEESSERILIEAKNDYNKMFEVM